MQHLYSTLKHFNYPNHLQALKKQKHLLAPVHVRIKPMNACNHSCWFCAYRADQLQLGEKMNLADSIPKEKMQEIVSDLIEMKVEAVTYSGGGEPLLYPHIIPAIESLGKAGIKQGFLTNGSYLKGKKAELIAKYGTWVRISMDSWDPKSHQASRKVKAEDFNNIIQNIRDFCRLESNCVLGISFIITQENFSHLLEFCQLMKEAGVNHVKVSGCIVSNCGRENNEYHHQTRTQVLSLIDQAMKLNSEHFSVVNHYHRATENFHKTYERCPFLQFLTVIGADSVVYTCQDKAYNDEGFLGSIKNRSFKDFWFSSENYQKVTNFNPSINCQHHCVAHEKNLSLLQFLETNDDHSAFV